MTLNTDRLRERYAKRKLYSRLSRACAYLGVMAALSGAIISNLWGTSTVVLILIGVALLLTVGILAFATKRDETALSSDEKVTVILTQAIPNLQSFLDKEREEDRNAAVKNLVDASREMDSWDFGTLELVEREIGKPAKHFRERFQKGLLPAVRTGDSATVRRMLALLDTIYSGFRSGNYTTENFQRWSADLEDLPDREVSTGLTRSLWLTPARRMAMITLVSLFSGFLVFMIALWTKATPKEALTIATPAFVGIFAGLAIFVAYTRPSGQG